MSETWECARCCRENTGVICRHCREPAHGAGDNACSWETLPSESADPLWLIQVCPHGLSRFATT